MDTPDAPTPKRKRSSPADAVPMPRQTAMAAAHASIKYVVERPRDRMLLLDAESDSLAEMNRLFNEYEGVLHRHESFAACLGAKLMAPLLQQSLEKLFGGPPVVVQRSFTTETPTWSDIVELARTKPSALTLETRDGNVRVCRVWVKDCQVDISEDDYRLIQSGAPERIMPQLPIAEDETAEMGTIDILEQRLTAIIKKVDSIAARARQFNYQLSKRRGAILDRQPKSHETVFKHANGDAGSSLHQDLLRQFAVADAQAAPPRVRPSLGGSVLDAQSPPFLPSPFVGDHAASPSTTPHLAHPAHAASAAAHRPPSQSQSRKPPEDHNRALVVPLMEKLARGDPIIPSCDRCRRLAMPCTKHQTACAGCTKKHARCTWKDATDDELAALSSAAAAAASSTPTAQLAARADVEHPRGDDRSRADDAPRADLEHPTTPAAPPGQHTPSSPSNTPSLPEHDLDKVIATKPWNAVPPRYRAGGGDAAPAEPTAAAPGPTAHPERVDLPRKDAEVAR